MRAAQRKRAWSAAVQKLEAAVRITKNCGPPSVCRPCSPKFDATPRNGKYVIGETLNCYLSINQVEYRYKKAIKAVNAIVTANGGEPLQYLSPHEYRPPTSPIWHAAAQLRKTFERF